MGNWAGAVWWGLAAVVMLTQKRGSNNQGEGKGGGLWKGHVAVLTVFVAGSVAAVMAACTVLRAHLFVWTVFSPKYLYCVAWSLGQHAVVNVVVGGVVYWLGSLEEGGG